MCLLPQWLLSTIVAYPVDLALQDQRIDVFFACLVILAILRINQIKSLLNKIFFDLADVLTVDSLTCRYVRKYLALGPLSDWDDPDGFKKHLAISRHVTHGDFDQEARAFQTVIEASDTAWIGLKEAMQAYWFSFRKDREFSRRQAANV